MRKLIFFAVMLVPQVLCVENKYCELYCDFYTENVTHTVCERAYDVS